MGVEGEFAVPGIPPEPASQRLTNEDFRFLYFDTVIAKTGVAKKLIVFFRYVQLGFSVLSAFRLAVVVAMLRKAKINFDC
jgi:hypothetical protein